MDSLEADLIACDRETALRGSFYDFVRLAWPEVYPSSPFRDNWHIPLICEHYEAALRGEIRELVINLPPGGSKSSLTCVMLNAWDWVRHPQRSYIYAAYGQHLVRRDAYAFRQMIQSDWWRKRFGDRFAIPTVPAVDNIKNDKGGFRFGTTPGGEVTGWHANVQVIDDPNKPEDLTKAGMDAVRLWKQRTLASRWRRPPELNALILIMQRLHCDDLSQLLIDQGAVHLCFPAEFDPTRRTVTKWGEDPRREAGELMDPVRLPASMIARLRKDLGLHASAQLDQAPVPEGGAVFKKEWLKYWDVPPPQLDQTIISWDCAYKDEQHADYVAGQVWGRCGGQFYLLEQTYGHLSFSATLKAIVGLREKYSGAITLIEEKANGPAIVQTLQAKVPGIVAVDPRGGKFSRAASCTGYFEAGDIFLPNPGNPGFSWVMSSYVPELLSFPRARHDDQVDATTQAILYLQENTSWLKAAMERVREMMG